MNKLQILLENPQHPILSIYLTAGYPYREATGQTILALQDSGVDMIEVGIPYSDPMADGPTIQRSSQIAIANGMTLDLLFDQLEQIRQEVRIPLLFMGYLNSIMQYGEVAFFRRCVETGISGVIIPDLPLSVYASEYQPIMEELDLRICFLIAPQTPKARIQTIDRATSGFLYIVADTSVTGTQKELSDTQIQYFDRIQSLGLNHPQIIGFGIRDAHSFGIASKYATGAIIGSAFLRAIEGTTPATLTDAITTFIGTIRNPQ